MGLGIELVLLKNRGWPSRRMVGLVLLLRSSPRRRKAGLSFEDGEHAQDIALRPPDRQSMASSPVSVCGK